MSELATEVRLRVVSFGDVEGELWGVAMSLGDEAVLVGGAPRAPSGVTVLRGGEWNGEDGSWWLRGDGVELSVGAEGEAPAESQGSAGRQELARIRGTVSIDGSEQRVDCVGVRFAVAGDGFSSLRAVAGWVAEDEAFGLAALRSAPGRGHEGDVVVATLFDPDGLTPVSDPRLSTTYDRTGIPARTSLELWVGEGEQEYPRRAAGEAAGPGAEAQLGRAALRVVPLRCHSRGRDGAGTYVLLTSA